MLEQHARLYPGIELTEIVAVRHPRLPFPPLAPHGVPWPLCLPPRPPRLTPCLLAAAQVKRAYLVSTVVHAKWKDFSRQLFPGGFAGTTAPDAEATAQLSFELGWLLFALGKCHMAVGATDPLSAYHFLSALIHLLLSLIPEEARTSTAFWPKLDGPISATTPQYPLPQGAQDHLWGLLKAVPAEIAKQQPTVAALLSDLAGVFALGEVHEEGKLTPEGGTKLRALLSPANLSETVLAVRTRYAAVWGDKSQLDDTFYLLPHDYSPQRPAHSPAASPCRPSTHSSASAGMSSPSAAGRASLLTPLRGSNPLRGQQAAIPQTPMSSQLESVGWLREAVRLEADASSLAKYFDACEVSPRTTIEERISTLCTKVQDVLQASELSSDVSEQLQLGRRLYYKMLLAFLEAEERRLHQTNFAMLLNNDAFHTSLLACCLESVFASYSTAHMAFPAILQHLELQPFDFGKVIESFIKHEPRLPDHLKRHFAEVEAKIVECLAWQEGSPLHALMSEYDAALTAGSAVDSPARGAPPPGSTRAKAALEQFVKKCLYLGAKRIQDLCLRLLLPSSLVQQVWAVVKLVLDKARHLLVGRHLDQLLMCAVYGVCKVNQRPVTFRHIIEQYRRQNGASPRTFREVRMRNATDPPQDIIQFYNVVFIPAMKDHLLLACSSSSNVPTATAPGGISAALATNGSLASNAAAHMSPDINLARGGSSPRHVSAGGARDLYVSSLTPNAHLTPRTRTLYAFSDTPAGRSDINSTERLRDINSNINGQPAAASALDVLGAAANGAQPVGAGGSPDLGQTRRSTRGELDLSKATSGGVGVMASGHKRSRALMEPQRSGSSAGSSMEDSG